MSIASYANCGPSPAAYGLPVVDPFKDQATAMMPYSVPAMYRYSEYFALSNETFRQALARTAAYFITELELEGEAEEEEKRDYNTYMTDEAGFYPAAFLATESMLVYGTSYCSAIRPFVRWLVCPGTGGGRRCRARYRFDAALARDPKYKFKWSKGFTLRCPVCGYQGDFGRPVDLTDPDAPICYRVWNPYDIRPHYEGYKDRIAEVDWVIPADYREDVKRGDPVTLASAPWEVLKAVNDGGDFRFATGYVHTWTDQLLAGVRTRGVGVPKAIVNFRVLYYLQILRRYNEALASAHVVPFRVVSPMPGGREPQGGDLLQNAAMMNMRTVFMRMVAQHTVDPGGWHWSPVPLQYQALGADARTMAPRELIDQGEAALLNGVGNPDELYRLKLTAQAQPLGLRLYEKLHAPLVHGLNRLTAFWTARTVAHKKWEPVRGKMARNTLIDQIELQQLRVQMAATGHLARGEGLKVLGTTFSEQTRKKMDENLLEAELNAEYQQKVQQSGLADQLVQQTDPYAAAQAAQQQQQGGGQAGQTGGAGAQEQQAGQTGGAGAPGQVPWDLVPPSGQQAIDPVEFKQRAETFAKALLDPAVPQTQRTSALNVLRDRNELFHSMVRRSMERLRNQAGTAGRDQQLALMARGA